MSTVSNYASIAMAMGNYGGEVVERRKKKIKTCCVCKRKFVGNNKYCHSENCMKAYFKQTPLKVETPKEEPVDTMG